MNKIIEDIKNLHKETGYSIMTCKKVLMEHPNLSKKQQLLYLSYYDWLMTFLDGDRSLERYCKKIGVNINDYIN